MKKSTFLGSAVSVLLLFSAISYSKTYIQQQNPKSNQVAQAPAQTSTDTVASKEAASVATSTERPREVATSITSAEEKAAAAECLQPARPHRDRRRAGNGNDRG